jgi:predicted methyltransferase
MLKIKSYLIAGMLSLSSLPVLADAITDAAASTERSAAAKARDEYRHPQQTLRFFGIKPEMTVVEIWPGGGWYSDILTPLLADKGQFIPLSSFHPEKALTIAPAGTVDAVLTFRNIHNWYMGQGDQGVVNSFKAFYTALKPGGMVGVVEHKLPESSSDANMLKSGYMKQSYVIAAAEKAGFVLAAESAVNRNPLDTADHPKGVWTLPPTLKLKDENIDHYMAIGESDRMTLKFVKPQ